MRRICAFAIAALLFYAGAAFAYPTLTGPTGQAVIPDANITPPGLTVAADWHDLSDVSDIDTSIPIRSIISFGPGFEFGLMTDPFINKSSLSDATGVNTKIRIGEILGGNTSIGGQFRREKDSLGFETDYTQGYIAWSSQFSSEELVLENASLTIGANWTQIEPDLGASVDAIRYFAGATVNVSKSLALLAEYQTEAEEIGDVDPMTAYTARLALSPSLAAQVGYTNAFGLTTLPEHSWFAGLSIGFTSKSGQ